jgi:hypothetical protein
LPLGQDCLLTNFWADTCPAAENQIVRFRRGTEMLETLRNVNGRCRTSQTGRRFRTDLRSNHLLWNRRDYGESPDSPSVTVTSSGSSDLLQPDPDQFALSDEFENAIVLSDKFQIDSALRAASW